MKKHTFWAVERDGEQRAIGATEARRRCRVAGTSLRALKKRAHKYGSFTGGSAIGWIAQMAKGRTGVGFGA
jgi:hypothetical protein